MKHYNDFLIVGIDHGYGNIKTANTVTPTGITKLDAALPSPRTLFSLRGATTRSVKVTSNILPINGRTRTTTSSHSWVSPVS